MLSYFRTLRKIVEEPDILPGSRRMNWSPRLANSLQSALLLFSVRTLLRSRHHRVIFSFYLGVGFAIGLAYLKPALSPHSSPHVAATAPVSVPLLTASILMMCVVVTGMRIVFSMPIAFRANWIFRITETRRVPEYLTAIRRTLLWLSCFPVWAVFAMLFLAIWPLRFAAGHLVILGLLGIIFTDLSVYGFQKIPFTCSYLPGKGNIQLVFWACVVLLPLTYAAARLEWQALQNLGSYVFAIIILSAAAAWARWRTAASARSAEALNFDEVPPVDILALGLRTDGEMLPEQS